MSVPKQEPRWTSKAIQSQEVMSGPLEKVEYGPDLKG